MLSFPKIIVLVAVVAIIWFGFRWFERWEKERRAAERPPGQLDRERRTTANRPAEDMVACPICGTYVAAAARSCGRANCPFPRS